MLIKFIQICGRKKNNMVFFRVDSATRYFLRFSQVGRFPRCFRQVKHRKAVPVCHFGCFFCGTKGGHRNQATPSISICAILVQVRISLIFIPIPRSTIEAFRLANVTCHTGQKTFSQQTAANHDTGPCTLCTLCKGWTVSILAPLTSVFASSLHLISCPFFSQNRSQPFFLCLKTYKQLHILTPTTGGLLRVFRSSQQACMMPSMAWFTFCCCSSVAHAPSTWKFLLNAEKKSGFS